MLAHCLRRCDTGGVRVVKVNVLSGLMVIVVGVGVVGLRCAVRALLPGNGDMKRHRCASTTSTYNSLQKSIALTPRAPSAGPTGGDGVAFPAGTRIF